MKITVTAEKRDTKGTGASRRLRKNGKIPGILYGNHKEAQSIVLDSKTLHLQFNKEAFHASILELSTDGEKESVLLRDYQLEPVKGTILHVDFQRVNQNEKIHVNVPFHFINEDIAKGVKLEGGVISHIMTEVDISCLPKDLPQYIEVDLENLELGHSIHLSDLKVPEGVEITALTHENDAAVTSIIKPKVQATEDVASSTDDSAAEDADSNEADSQDSDNEESEES
ncbi:MAG: 50S ribosomal protein L25/general stress protein Ctc [Methylophilaceae bacterium]